MDLLEVAVRELVPGFRVFAFLIVQPQMPLRVLSKSVLADELILLLGRWLVFTPVVPFVPHYLSFVYERFRKLESGVVEFLCHTLLPLPCVFRNGSSL